MSRIVVWFSCGAASACASKLIVDKYGHENVHIVYCNTLASEHPDNLRFLRDIESWLSHPIELIASEKYVDIDAVFEKTKYMAGPRGARCTVEMKRIPREDYQEYSDTHVFGLTFDEENRIKRFKENNPNLKLEWILQDNEVTKSGCYEMLKNNRIALPTMYSLGFKNNNCIGCVKATSPIYWDRVRKNFPEVFKKRCQQSRYLGVRLLEYHGNRVFLDELPTKIVDRRKQKQEEDIECGPICLREKGQ